MRDGHSAMLTFVRETDGYLHAGDAELIRVAGDVEEVVYKIGNG